MSLFFDDNGDPRSLEWAADNYRYHCRHPFEKLAYKLSDHLYGLSVNSPALRPLSQDYGLCFELYNKAKMMAPAIFEPVHHHYDLDEVVRMREQLSDLVKLFAKSHNWAQFIPTSWNKKITEEYPVPHPTMDAMEAFLNTDRRWPNVEEGRNLRPETEKDPDVAYRLMRQNFTREFSCFLTDLLRNGFFLAHDPHAKREAELQARFIAARLEQHFYALATKEFEPMQPRYGVCAELERLCDNLRFDTTVDTRIAKVFFKRRLDLEMADYFGAEPGDMFPVPHGSLSNKDAYSDFDNLWQPTGESTAEDIAYFDSRYKFCHHFAIKLGNMQDPTYFERVCPITGENYS